MVIVVVMVVVIVVVIGVVIEVVIVVVIGVVIVVVIVMVNLRLALYGSFPGRTCSAGKIGTISECLPNRFCRNRK